MSVLCFCLCGGCQHASGDVPRSDAQRSREASVRLFLLASLAGALEPCGCRPGMVGGLDHAAALLRQQSDPRRDVLLAAGPTLFDPRIQAPTHPQYQLKARTIALALADMGLAGWAPGDVDLAVGMPRLASRSLAFRWPRGVTQAWLGGRTAPVGIGADLVVRAGLRVGVVAVTLADEGDAGPAARSVQQAEAVVAEALASLQRRATDVDVLLAAGPRASALSLISRVSGFAVALIGSAKPGSQDAAPGYPPLHVGETLVMTPPGELGALGVVELRRAQGRVLVLPGANITVDDQPGRDPQVAARIDAYHQQVARGTPAASRPPNAVPGPQAAGYVGEARCAGCHDAAHVFWNTTAHARAFWTLLDKGRARDLDCVGCHVTGHPPPDNGAPGMQAVQCEACHGPGQDHAKTAQPDTIVRRPDPALCRDCHHPPHVPGNWDLERAWAGTLGLGHGADP